MSDGDLLREVTPLSVEDCFLVVKRIRQGFAYPLHVHPEFELNYLENAGGAIRIVGESVEEIGDLDLVLVAGGTKHTYSNHKCSGRNISETTIQFHASLFDSLINKRLFKTIKDMFKKASCGLIFGQEMIKQIQPELKALSNDEPDSFHNLIRLIEILKTLSLDRNSRRLNAINTVGNFNNIDDGRLDTIILFLHENYHRSVLLEEVASLINMSEASLTRFLKKWTGKTFVDNLNDIRIAEASCRLIDTNDTIAEICYKCGFNNLSNFNRVFKKKKGSTPTKYREKLAVILF